MTESNLPLLGRRIVVTRARAQASSLVITLSDLGAEVIELPTIETVTLDSYDALDSALLNIHEYQWLIVTSANTIRVIGERLAVLGLEFSGFANLKTVAIGSATAREMIKRGIAVDVLPEQYVAESLIDALGDQIRGDRVLLARARIARDLVPQELTRRGAVVDVVDAYQTVVPDQALERMKQVFANTSQPLDVVTFTSSSTVKNFFLLWREAGFSGIPAGAMSVSIGPQTSETLRECGWPPAAEAEIHDVAGIVAAVVQKLARPVSV